MTGPSHSASPFGEPVNEPEESDSGGPPGEDDLLACLERGDRGAAEALVDRTYREVYAALIRLTGDRELAADLTQETYRKAWKALTRFDRRSRLATWLYRIAYNTFLNHVRRPRPLQSLDDAGEHRDPRPGQEELIQRREVALRLRRAVMGLDDDLRFTVTARFWAELPVAEIARHENVTGAAVRKRLKKATQLLRAALEEDAA